MIGIDEVIPMTSDAVFKKIMKEKKEYTIRLIHLITELPEEMFQDAIFRDTELVKQKKDSKKKIADIFITTDSLTINLEANYNYTPSITKRNLYYYMETGASMIKTEHDYNEDILQYQINFNVHGRGKKLINRFMWRDDENEALTQDFQIYNISLAKLKEKRYTKDVNEELVNLLKVMTEKNILKLDEIAKSSLVKGVVETMKEYSKDTNMIGAYYEEEEREKIQRSVTKDLAKDMAKDMAKDLAKDMAKDLAKDMAKETVIKEKQEIAKNLIKLGLDMKDIVFSTGLSEEEVTDILSESVKNSAEMV